MHVNYIPKENTYTRTAPQNAALRFSKSNKQTIPTSIKSFTHFSRTSLEAPRETRLEIVLVCPAHDSPLYLLVPFLQIMRQH